MNSPGQTTDITSESRARDYRLVVRSIGNADAAVVSALRRVRAAPDSELAAILYRAPSELVTDLDLEMGTRLRDLIRQTGVDVELMPVSEPFEPGTGEFEIALAVKRYDRMLEVVEETARILGVAADAAMKIVCATPAVLIGGVSAATVEAMRVRYERLGVEIDVSRTGTARFDVAAEVNDEPTRRLFTTLLSEAGVVAGRTGADQYLATELDNATATRIWERLSRTPAKVRVLNRDFERFDVRLDAPPVSDDAIEWLVSATGMPASAAEKAVASTPFVLAEAVPLASMLELLEAVHARGGRASAVLLPLKTFSLQMKARVGDRQAARSWIEAIAGPADLQRFDRGQTDLPGPFTKTQARWLQFELRRRGIPSHLVER